MGRQLDKIGDRIEGINETAHDFLTDWPKIRTDSIAAIQRQIALEQEMRGIAEKIEKIDQRTRLFISLTDTGPLFLKEGDYISDTVARGEPWDEHVQTAIAETSVARDGCAVDVGAHIGLLTIAMAKRFKRVVSFEPNLMNFGILVANMAIGRLNNVQCINGALFSHDAELSLGRPKQQEIPVPVGPHGQFDWRSAKNLGAYTFTENGSKVLPTKATTLDSYDLDDVALIKIDVQGADGEVIKGALKTIQRCRPVVIFEWEEVLSQAFPATLAEIQALLKGTGYNVEVLKSHNRKQTDYIARPA
jgi:FkbM family methyltransferase